MISYLAAFPLMAPVLYFQGKTVRKNALELPEASGIRDGAIGDGQVIRLLIIGDSSAAGVGVSKQSEALAGRLVERLSRCARIEWKLVAKTGATTTSTIRLMRKETQAHYDHVVICLGVNDVTSTIAVRHWIKAQRELRFILRSRFTAHHLIVSGLPPLRLFPLLPQPLRWYLGCRAIHFCKRLKFDLEDESDCSYQELDFIPDVNVMAADGFHPGPDIYQAWAIQVAETILHFEKKHFKNVRIAEQRHCNQVF